MTNASTIHSARQAMAASSARLRMAVEYSAAQNRRRETSAFRRKQWLASERSGRQYSSRWSAQLVAFNSYVKTPAPPSPERTRAIAALRAEFGLPAQGAAGGGGGGINALPVERRVEFQQRMAQLDGEFPPPPRATVKDFVDHIDYAVKLIGIDHVGISSDFDGGGGVDGWNDASETFNVTLELVRRGYTEEQIAKLWSGNLWRVMDEVQQVARRLQAE